MREIIEKLKRLEEAQKDYVPSFAGELSEIRRALEAREKPGAQICWVEGIQRHSTCELTTSHCGFWSYAEGEKYLNGLRAKHSDMTYVKLFPVHVKEVK